MEQTIGIYFLWLKAECVYVGQSTDVIGRIKKHRGVYAFDRFTVMECAAHDLDAFETRFIMALKPLHNSQIPNNAVSFPSLPRQMHGRFAGLNEIRTALLPNFLQPVPSMETIRAWFDDAKIPRIKSNPLAKRGGGTVWYSVAAVEKFITSKTMPGKAVFQ